MKNPCDNCLIKVNCTAVCFEKINYKFLLKNAVLNNALLRSNIQHIKNYRKYSAMLSLTMMDEFNISKRAEKALNP